MYLVELQQRDRRHTVGLFRKKNRYPFTKYTFTSEDGRIELIIWDKVPLSS